MTTPRKPSFVTLPPPDTAEAEPRRKPEAVVLEPKGTPGVVVRIEADDDAAPAEPPRRKPFGWGVLFFGALSLLLSLAFGLALARFIDELFTFGGPLGWIGLVLTAVLIVAALVILVREVGGLLRLGTVARLRRDIEAVHAGNDPEAGRAAVRAALAFTASNPRTAKGRRGVEAALDDIIDGRMRVTAAERDLMKPLDEAARLAIAETAKRVSLATAVSPRALFDIAIVFVSLVMLIRKLADIYGARPATLGTARLVRSALTHLAVTGGMAAGESALESLMGQGLAARLSAKLGEGVLNGLMTARLGLSAIEAVRPFPFVALPAPKLREVAADLWKTQGDPALEKAQGPRPDDAPLSRP